MISPGLFEILKLGMVGLVAGLFSSVLAQRDHRRRTYWEIRVQAYRETIQCLSDLVHYYEVKYHAELHGYEVSAEREKQLDEMWERAFHRLRTHIDSGAFLFSDAANQTLTAWRAPTDREQAYFEMAEQNYLSTKSTLEKMVKLSKIDLDLRPRWQFWKD